MNRGKILGILTAGHAAEHWYLGILGPVLPFLIADLDISLTQVGILFAGRAAFGALSSAGTGFVIDKMGGGKWALVVCLGGLALFHGGMSQTSGLLTLLPVFWLTGLVSHLWHPPSMGFIGQQFSDRKGFALGLHGTGANIGQTLSPLIAGYLLLIAGWRTVLLVNMVPLILAATLIGIFLPAFRTNPKRSPKDSDLRFRRVSGVLLTNPLLASSLLIAGSITIAHNGLQTFLPILLVSKYGASPGWVGLCLGLYSASAIIPETAVGYISDTISRKFVLIFGLAAGGLSLILIPAMAPGPWMLIPLTLVGIFLRSLRPVVFANALEVTPENMRGSTIGLLFTVNQGFAAVGPLAAGFLSDAYGIDSALWFFGGIALAMIPLFAILPKIPDKIDVPATAQKDSAHQPS
ncbi:MAG: MFS transporter [Nitrospinota bacterium]